jgi:hypothetical protein
MGERGGNRAMTRIVVRVICLGGLIAPLVGCAASPDTTCPPGLGQRMLVFDLFFGRAIPGRDDLTDQEWQTFLTDTVTVNLPDGYTVLDAAGAWMNPTTQKTVSEATKVILVALPDKPGSLDAVNRVRTAYQVRLSHQGGWI